MKVIKGIERELILRICVFRVKACVGNGPVGDWGIRGSKAAT